MALAMSWVSMVPDAPTTVPAMIIAALPRTKPSKPTARPVKALYREITTGMSAPPTGNVISTPKLKAATKNRIISVSPPPKTISANPSRTANAVTVTLTCCWRRNRMGRSLISRCSLAKATRLPLNAIAPIRAPATARTSRPVPGSSPRSSSTAAMAPAAPPPMPLKMATIWGISVMATCREAYHDTAVPSATAITIKP